MKTLHSENELRNARNFSYSKMFNTVENFLWGDTKLSPEFKKEFHKYITSQFTSIGCCVIWSRDTTLNDLLARYGIPSIGAKEIIINKNFDDIAVSYISEDHKIVSYIAHVSTFNVCATDHFMHSQFRQILSNDSYWTPKSNIFYKALLTSQD